MLKELIAVVGMANETNRLVESYQVEVDDFMNQGSERVIRRSTEAHHEFLSTCNEVRKKIASDSINPTARLTISIED